MTIQKRSTIIGLLFTLTLILYGTARLYAPALVLYIVEQTLIQKAPPGTDSAVLHARLHECIAEAPDRKARMERLFRISAHLEKVQTVTPQDLDRLLATEKPSTSPANKSYLHQKSGTFSVFQLS
jgi:hypothetical protein